MSSRLRYIVVGLLLGATSCGGADELATTTTPEPTMAAPPTMAYDREAFCAAWHDTAPEAMADLTPDQQWAAIRAALIAGPADLPAAAEVMDELAPRALPLLRDIHDLDDELVPSAANRRAELEQEVATMLGPVHDAFGRLETAANAECPTAFDLPDLAKGTELATYELSAGATLRFVEVAPTAEHSDQEPICVVLDNQLQGCHAPPTEPAAAPSVFGGEVGRIPPEPAAAKWYVVQYFIQLPAGSPRIATVLDDSGAVLPSAQSSDGTFVIAVVADLHAEPADFMTQTLDLIATDGSTAYAEVATGVPGTTINARR